MSLNISTESFVAPEDVKLALENIEDFWETPDGEELKYSLEVHGAERQIAMGFHYVLDWGEDGPDEEYLDARKAWRKLVNKKLKYDRTEKENYTRARDYYERLPDQAPGKRALFQWLEELEKAGFDDQHEAYQWFREHKPQHPPFKRWRNTVKEFCKDREVYLDSPLLVFEWYRHQKPEDPTFQKWCEVKDRPLPPRKPIWISDDVVNQALEWGRAQRSAPIIWTHHQAVLDRFAEHIPAYGEGTEMPDDRHLCAASISVHGTGQQLQAWDNQLILQPPSGGKRFEQLLGRTHRPGQRSDEVNVTINVYGPYKDSLKSAKIDARYLQETTGAQQKLEIATWL